MCWPPLGGCASNLLLKVSEMQLRSHWIWEHIPKNQPLSLSLTRFLLSGYLFSASSPECLSFGAQIQSAGSAVEGFPPSL